MDAVLETFSVGKVFRTSGGPVRALDSVSLSVPRGIVFGLLGPNGAGKSTLLRIVLDLVRPTQGSFKLLGAARIDARVLRRVGALIEAPSLYPFLTARDVLDVLARTSGFRERARIDALLERVGLAQAANRPVRTFSMGMKQRLGVAAALLARPELLILDEPTNGLDPPGIQEMRALVRELVTEEGVTIILSSHLLDEVQKVCDRVAILDHGRLIAEGAVADFLATRGVVRIKATPPERALQALGAAARLDGEEIVVDAAREATPALIRALVAADVAVFEARWSSPTLEEIFLSEIGGGR